MRRLVLLFVTVLLALGAGTVVAACGSDDGDSSSEPSSDTTSGDTGDDNSGDDNDDAAEVDLVACGFPVDDVALPDTPPTYCQESDFADDQWEVGWDSDLSEDVITALENGDFTVTIAGEPTADVAFDSMTGEEYSVTTTDTDLESDSFRVTVILIVPDDDPDAARVRMIATTN